MSLSAEVGYVPAIYVHTRVTVYQSAVLDLRRSQALHCCQLQACRLNAAAARQSQPPNGLRCAAVHHGLCTSVVVLRSSRPAHAHPRLPLPHPHPNSQSPAVAYRHPDLSPVALQQSVRLCTMC